MMQKWLTPDACSWVKLAEVALVRHFVRLPISPDFAKSQTVPPFTS
jgi:hypothetical protein